ncbi:DUF3617 domain-containing protein [Phenylobacterium sp.]|jgi:hypothetical protein|uniref:DUF3617 domain-containing protein n=1 Tax=Phenylobacterium sp. TaxID=1871053 RepID=UPI002F3E6D38
MNAALPFALVLAACAGAAAAAETIQPGYWESTNRVLSPIRTTSTERRCITPADVEKFMMGPSNRHYACTYPTRAFEDGKILLKGTCVSKKGQQVALSGEGAYTPTSFTLTADVATEILGIPIAGKVRTESHRIADACPPPEAAPEK